ncbi:Oxidoreductase, FAD-binding domain-containing protein [Rozella allomycis CSF55]|uniref:NADH-cytochrome b5 reductase n=1 Tax=Rozella allomycis (strain CSF55) TaxID=988480 RepID=A0A075AR32_ROZAC|nr:Oxidoreductase, FAD-binding domain-containing protein [Rozella allomycis CSF55]|eukprot:EPZ32751.1 Oxidoreductase, FAD-binding domain-containing protein [Rozella allomycis CSF55]
MFVYLIPLGVVVYAAYNYLKRMEQKVLLRPNEWFKLPLKDKQVLSHNTAIYTFSLPSPDQSLGLPIGKHISARTTVDEKVITRSYTPISSNDDIGILKLLVKTYPNGNLSKVFSELKVGDYLEISGPKGNFEYAQNMVDELGMIAGGSGITPMYQIIQYILSNGTDRTKISLIFANVSEEDILLRKELDDLQSKFNNFKVYYVLNKPPENWKYGTGFVSADMIRQNLPKPSSKCKILLCGPPPMIKAMCSICEEVGFEKPNVVSKMTDQVFKF